MSTGCHLLNEFFFQDCFLSKCVQVSWISSSNGSGLILIHLTSPLFFFSSFFGSKNISAQTGQEGRTRLGMMLFLSKHGTSWLYGIIELLKNHPQFF